MFVTGHRLFFVFFPLLKDHLFFALFFVRMTRFALRLPVSPAPRGAG